MKPLAFPVVANVDARPNTDPGRVKELLVRQVDGAVRWEQAVRLMHMRRRHARDRDRTRARSSRASASASRRT